MKKFITLCMALVMTMGLMAVPARMANPNAPLYKVAMENGKVTKSVQVRMAALSEEEEVVFSEMGFGNGEEVYEVEVNDYITISFTDGTQTSPKYYDSGTAIRVYVGGSMKVEGLDGAKISKIEMDYSLNSSATLTAKSGSLKNNVWTGDEEEVEFSVGTKGHVRFKSLTITYEEGTPVVPKDTLYDTIGNVQFVIDDTYAYYGIYFGAVYGGDTTKNYFEASILSEEELEDLAGVYMKKDLYGYYFYHEGKEIDVRKLTLNVEEAEGMNRVANAEILGKDTFLYRVSLEYIVPEKANDTTYLNFDKARISHYSDGDYYFYAYNEDTVFTLDIFTDVVPGEYDMEDMYLTYCNMIQLPEEIYTGYYTLKAKVEERDEKYMVTAEMFAYDTILYIVTFEVPVPKASSTVDIEMEGELYDDYLDYYGILIAEGISEDEKYLGYVYVYADDVTGQWGFDDVYSLGVAELVGVGDTVNYEYYNIDKVTATAKGDDIVVKYSFMGQSDQEDNKFVNFNVTMTCAYQGSGLDEQMAEEAIKKMFMNNQVVICTDEKKFNVLGQEVK